MNCFSCVFVVAGGGNGVIGVIRTNLYRKRKVLLLFFFVIAVTGGSDVCEISGKMLRGYVPLFMHILTTKSYANNDPLLPKTISLCIL